MLSVGGVSGGYPLLMDALPATIGPVGTILQLGNVPSVQDRPALVAGAWPADNEIAVPDSGMISKSDGSAIDGRSMLGQTATRRVPISKGLEAPRTIAVSVVGVYKWVPDQGIQTTAYTSLSTIESILTSQGTWHPSTDPAASAGFGTYVIDANTPGDVARIASQLEARGLVTQYVEQTVHGLSSRIQSIQAVAAVLVLIVFFAALSISNTLVQAVNQRRREIAVLLAVGFSPAWVGASVAAETVLVGLASVVVGLVAAEIVVAVVAGTQPGLDLQVGPASILIVGAGALVFCLGASWLPTQRAMRIDPVEVLREE